jgi:Ferric reductase like transmembrane component/Ferric reductase NAD binding domain
MAWPYRFVSLSPEQIYERRKLLGLYGFCAWVSPIIVVLSIYLVRLLLTRTSSTSPHSSSNKASTFFQVNIRRLLWILESPLPSDFATVKVHLIGLLYISWLLFLTVHQTGDDYMHFTKRLGHNAVSQLPFQYLLSIKSPLSPIQLATNLTHETLNPYHRLTGRIIHLFLLAHSILYLNFFYAISVLPQRLYGRDVQLGILSITLLTALAITALSPLRQKAYHKIFYVPHVLLSFLLLPAIFAHVPYTRKYIFQTFVIYLFNAATRKINTSAPPTPAIVTPVEGTNGALLHMTIPIALPPFGSPIPTHSPGQHVYLKSGHNPMSPRSPFTIASVPPVLPPGKEKPSRGYPIADMELVVRNLGGPTTAWLAGLNAGTLTTMIPKNKNESRVPIGASNTSANDTDDFQFSERKINVLVEGPYGLSSFIPPLLSSFLDPKNRDEEVLLIAGGVGATFTLPVYISLLRMAIVAAAATPAPTIDGSEVKQPHGNKDIDINADTTARVASISKRIHFHWIVRSREEAEWGVEYLRQARSELRGLESMNAKIYITHASKTEQQREPNGPSGHLAKSQDEAPMEKELPPTCANTAATSRIPQPGVEIITQTQTSGSNRPSLSTLINSIFLPPPAQQPTPQPDKQGRKHNRITILICAPPALTNSVRKEVGRHVLGYGRDVGWHQEAFGMGV